MKKLALLAVALLPFLTACGGGDTHEALATQTMNQMKSLATTLEGVKDKAGWEKAKPALDKILTALEGIGKKVKALPKLDEKAEKALNDKIGKDMGEIQQRMMQAGMKLASMPDIAADVGKFMQDMGKRMESMK